LGKPGRLIICAESGVQIGTGHVMRCLALAQAWKRAGCAITFVVREGLPGIEERVRVEGISLRTLPKESRPSPDAFVHEVLGGDFAIAVLDGYSFGEREQQELSEAGIRVLTVDDYGHATGYPVRWVLNQNAYASQDMYARRTADTRLLLGPRYALLRNEFSPWMGWRRTIPGRAQKILITIGGSDPENASQQILGSLDLLEYENLDVVLLVGSGNPHAEALRRQLEGAPVPVRILGSVQDMPAWMAWADVAIAGAGVTSYELCYMGLPSLLLIVAENQRRIAERLSELGAAVNAGTTREFRRDVFAGHLRSLIESAERRESLSERARELVDGLGSQRVRAALVDRELKLREARNSDCELLFGWADDPVARAASFQSAAISWENHSLWFAERLRDTQSVIYIGENINGEAVGLVRFQLTDDRALLSVNVAPKFRRQGWGRELITFSTDSLIRTRSVRRVDAFVKPDNHRSVRLFEASGFRNVGKERVADQDAFLFTLPSGIVTGINQVRSPEQID
jgi:UDP-2,4-diacetamido-2,4,6-trideoxy-beta-L-altropyranose hydrolase